VVVELGGGAAAVVEEGKAILRANVEGDELLGRSLTTERGPKSRAIKKLALSCEE
jgi:hypothetical protein